MLLQQSKQGIGAPLGPANPGSGDMNTDLTSCNRANAGMFQVPPTHTPLRAAGARSRFFLVSFFNLIAGILRALTRGAEVRTQEVSVNQ
jgi:hypothetical protein